MSNKYTAAPREIRRVTSVEMCRRFNEGGYWEAVKSGELTAHILESRRSFTLVDEVLEIQSQMVSYRNAAGDEVARVHQFLISNGTIAASGMPDPKRLLEDGVLYRLEKKPRG